MRKFRKIYSWILFIAVFAYLGFVFGYYFDNTSLLEIPFYLHIIIIIVLLIVVFIFNVFFHEFGHMVFGLLTGFKFVSFRLFSFVLYRDNSGKLKFGKSKVVGISGQCLLYYPKEYNKKISFFWYNSGGGLFNLLLAGIFSLLMYVSRNSYCLSMYFLFSMAICFMLALSNLLPLVSINDGANYLASIYNEDCKKSFYDQLNTVYDLTNGVDIKDVKLLDYDYNSTECLAITAYLFKSNVYSMNNNMEESRKIIDYLENNFNRVPKEFKISVLVEIAIYRAIYENDIPCVKHLFAKLKKNELKLVNKVNEMSFTMGSVIYYAYVENDFISAKNVIKKEEELINMQHYVGLRRMYLEWLDVVKNYMENIINLEETKNVEKDLII